MSDGPEWFAAKRYGYGAGLPISWQGWLVSGIFLAVVFGAALLLQNKPLLILSVVLPAAAIMMVITARTTKGGWRWRWGDSD